MGCRELWKRYVAGTPGIIKEKYVKDGTQGIMREKFVYGTLEIMKYTEVLNTSSERKQSVSKRSMVFMSSDFRCKKTLYI